MENAWIRPLNPMEQAFTLSNARLPLCVVCVLHLSDVPDDLDWMGVLLKLQRRHELLQCGIDQLRGRLHFRKLDPSPSIPFEEIKAPSEDQWKNVAETALNTIFETDGPLMKCWLLREQTAGHSELIVCFHHAIIDGSAARLILHEILSIAGGMPLPEVIAGFSAARLPVPFRGESLVRKLSAFMLRQMKREWSYSRIGLQNAIPQHSENAVISLHLDKDVSRKLAVKVGRAGLGLNSVLLAAMLKATIQYRYHGHDRDLARLLSFVDLRSSMEPEVSQDELGCFISMLRLEVNTGQEPSEWELARQVHRALFSAGRRGEVFAMFKMSKHFVRMALSLKNTRLGVCAISFIGRLELQASYGPLQLGDVKAYITNNQYGPELSAFGKILFGRIGLDFTYLTAETSREQAEQMIGEIQRTLEKMAE
ncbi:MAG: hypothetical protein R2824_26450 [Saprospiraceae bacterium]